MRSGFALFRALHPRLMRFAPTFALIGIVAVVLVGRGFWVTIPGGDAPGNNDLPVLFAAPAATENFPSVINEAFPANDAPVAITAANVPGQSALNTLRNTASGPSFAGYVSRPAASVTLPGRRIRVVSAHRGDTIEAIARREGGNVNALLYANSVADPTQPLALGQALRVPPPGTMLHRVKEADTLEGIAKAYNVGVEQITSYKGNTVQQSGDLVPGDFLIVPTLNLPMRDKVVFYQVHEGDSLSKISALYNLANPQTLQWANSLPSADLVQPGQVVAVPPADGVIHVVESEDLKRTTDDAVTQIAKNFACEQTPCAVTPSDERVNALATRIFAFGPNHLTHGGKLIQGQEIVIPGGIPFVEPPPVIIPRNVIIDNPDTTTATIASSNGSRGNTVTTTTTTRRPTTTSGGSTTTTTVSAVSASDNYGGGSSRIASVAARYLGQTRQPSGLPWAFWCEKFIGDVADQSGVGHYRYPTALADAYAGKIYRGHAPAGALVFFDQSWNPAGHVGIAMGDGTMISALGNGVVRTAYEGSSGYIGWRPFP